jgi:hypothetical protein
VCTGLEFISFVFLMQIKLILLSAWPIPWTTNSLPSNRLFMFAHNLICLPHTFYDDKDYKRRGSKVENVAEEFLNNQ